MAQKTDGCWIWTGARKENGYGAFQADGHRYAHRWAYAHYIGPIPPGLMVCHRCDNPPCVNPAHLFVGTQQDNQHDMVAKRRSLYGERHNLVQLTEQQVLEIRALWAQGGLLQRDIGARYGVSKGVVSSIVRGDTWKHLLPEGWKPPPARKWSRAA